MQQQAKNDRVPAWLSVVVVALVTGACFWLTGGQHYFANQAQIEYRLFHHEEDQGNPLHWLSWLVETGAAGGSAGLVVSSLAIASINARPSSSRK